MRLPFRDFHIIQFLESWWPSHESKPARALDKALYLYFRENKALGSKDREQIAQEVYSMIRWKSSLDARGTNPLSWLRRLQCLRAGALNDLSDLADHEKVGLPLELFNQIKSSYGLEAALEIGRVLQEPAPVFLRVNELKITREKLLQELPGEWGATAGALPNSVYLKSRPSIFQSIQFKQGLFEMQDEGSQALAAQVQAKPGDWVLDYCAGSGGKSLALAPLMQGKGQLFLHDIRLHALQEARKRLKRAGIQNAQTLDPHHKQLKRLKKSCDWVLVDAPCSGTGTLRRNPDMKERLKGPYIEELVALQRQIFAQAIEYVKPGGQIVYATCSILNSENEEQVAWFTNNFELQLCDQPLKLLPTSNSHDGFFCARFELRRISLKG